jgi:hypothetical protein
MRHLECGFEIAKQVRKNPRQRRRARDQNIVMPLAAMKGEDGRSSGAKPALGAVASDRISDLSAGGETDPDMGVGPLIVRCQAGFEGEAGRDAACGAGGAQEIGAFPQAVQR